MANNKKNSMVLEQVSPARLQLAEEAFRLRQLLEAGDNAVRGQLAETEARLDGQAFKVPYGELERLQKELLKAVKRALRIGAMPPIFQLVNEQISETTTSSSGKVCLLILIGGQVSPAEGWRYLACIEHLSSGNQIRRLPGATGSDLSSFANAEPYCQHCNLKRARKRSFLVEDPERAIRQVGSSCLTDYIGGATAEQAARYAESLLDLATLLAEAEVQVKSLKPSGSPDLLESQPTLVSQSLSSGSADPSLTGCFDIEQYLGWVCLKADQGEFVSRGQAFKSGVPATADQARSALLGALQGSSLEHPSQEQEEAGRQMSKWSKSRFSGSRAGLSDYEMRVAEVLDLGPLCDYRSLPLLAGLYPAYSRFLEEQAAASASPSRHLGQTGERIEVKASVAGISERETSFGLQRIYRLIDEHGNHLTWFSTSAEILEVGNNYQLRGTVKRHDDFKGIKRTVLSRCQIF